jgi:hypothetical protein
MLNFGGTSEKNPHNAVKKLLFILKGVSFCIILEFSEETEVKRSQMLRENLLQSPFHLIFLQINLNAPGSVKCHIVKMKIKDLRSSSPVSAGRLALILSKISL